MMGKASVGKVVKADFGGGDGEEFALLVDVGDDKDTLVPLGKGEKLGYREPEDRDDAGSGRTWWNA
jgi:hypothetical protein